MVDHDRLFKELLTTFFLEFLELFLPETRAYLEEDSITFLDKEIFTDVTSGERYEPDIVVRARLRGQDTFIIIHVENQSYAQGEFGARMFRYFALLHLKFDLPVYPIVIFSYDQPRNEQPDTYQVQFPDRVVLEFRYRVIQLNRLNWRDYVRHPNPVASALMAKMRIAPEERPFVKVECLRLLATLGLDRARMQLIAGFVDTYLRLSAEEEQIVLRETQRYGLTEQEDVMEIVTSWEERGIQKGLEQGLEQGRQHQAALILRQLEKRLGPIEAGLREKILSLSLEQLDELGEALLDFASAQDLSSWLNRLPDSDKQEGSR